MKLSNKLACSNVHQTWPVLLRSVHLFTYQSSSYKALIQSGKKVLYFLTLKKKHAFNFFWLLSRLNPYIQSIGCLSCYFWCSRWFSILSGVLLESSWPQYGDLMDGGPDFGLLRSLEAKNILRSVQVLPVHCTAFTSNFY